MALKPNLKVKVDELFLTWLTEPNTQVLLKTNLHQLLKGEPVTRAVPSSPQNSFGPRPGNHIHLKQQSPRLRPSSPQAPPCSPSIASPRSPRPRNLGVKSQAWQGQVIQKVRPLFKFTKVISKIIQLTENKLQSLEVNQCQS